MKKESEANHRLVPVLGDPSFSGRICGSPYGVEASGRTTCIFLQKCWLAFYFWRNRVVTVLNGNMSMASYKAGAFMSQ